MHKLPAYIVEDEFEMITRPEETSREAEQQEFQLIEKAEVLEMEPVTEIHADVLIEARRPFAYASEVQCQISAFESATKSVQVCSF